MGLTYVIVYKSKQRSEFQSRGNSRKGEAVILVMTQAHCEPILERLEREGFDVRALSASGQLMCEEAERLLSSFMFDGIIDEQLFRTKIGGRELKRLVANAQCVCLARW